MTLATADLGIRRHRKFVVGTFRAIAGSWKGWDERGARADDQRSARPQKGQVTMVENTIL